MASTLTRTQPFTSADSNGLRFEARRKARHPLLAASSVLLIAVCGAIFATAYLHAGHQVSVLALARTVDQGQSLSSDDLTVVGISHSPEISVVAARSLSDVLGRHATVKLEQGSLLVPADLASSSSIPDGDAVVGVAVKPGQLPALGVVSGEAVDVVLTGTPGAPYNTTPPPNSQQESQQGASTIGDAAGTIIAPEAQVTDVLLPAASSGSDTIVVSLLLPMTLAPIVASASAAEQVALVVVAGPS